MGKFILKRLGQMVLVLLAVSVIIFALVRITPSDPVASMTQGKSVSEETKQELREHYHLDKSAPEQYIIWVTGIFKGDLGESYQYKQSVGFLIGERIGTTMTLVLLSGVLAALLAARETGVGDYVMTSLYGTGNFVTAGFATNCNYGYEWPREAHTMSPLGQGYKCRDGRYIYVFVNDYTSVWPKFAKALRLPEEVVTDPRFTTKESTTIIANRSALVDIIREYALQRDAQDILDELVAYDVPSCILNQYKDRFSGEWLEQSVSNGYLIEHTYPSGNKTYLAQMPIYFDSLGVQDLYAQHRALGADNEAIEKEFGDGE
mgnify:CR=1 FL=1